MFGTVKNINIYTPIQPQTRPSNSTAGADRKSRKAKVVFGCKQAKDFQGLFTINVI